MGDDKPRRPPALVVGAASMLGWTVLRQAAPEFDWVATCSRRNRSALGAPWLRLNPEEPGAWDTVAAYEPRLVIYCGGVCDVGRCQTDPVFARSINIEGVRALLRVLDPQTRLVYVSTDHVFGGGPRPFDESMSPQPISVYGSTRVAAEALVAGHPNALIVRVGLPVGPSHDGRRGHLDWLRSRSARGLPMTIVAGESRSAVWADCLGRRIMALACSTLVGVRHIAATQCVSRVELADWLCRRLGLPAQYDIVQREALPYPHLGRVELATCFADALAVPLAGVMDPR